MRWFFLLAIALAGCSNLPAGDVKNVQPISPNARVGNVYLVRGWQGLYSTGVDEFADELKQNGIRASVFRAEDWRALSEAIVTAYKSPENSEPLVLVGFSYGADDVISIARDLNDHKIPVTLLITIDPVTPSKIPPNAKQSFNYFQTNGVWDTFPWFRGVPVEPDRGAEVVNFNLRENRKDLLEENTSHETIAGNPKLHAAILQEIMAVCPEREGKNSAGASVHGPTTSP